MNMKITRGRSSWLVAMAAFGVIVGGCEFLDPTNVENPRTTEGDLAEAEEPTAALLPGLRAQLARALSAVVSTTENVSDNYSIHGTGINKDFDDARNVTPQVANGTGTGGGGAYWNLQELRALSDFVLAIAADDATSTPDQIAEARYYRGLALLMLGENFAAAPIEEDGQALTSDALIQAAVAEFQAASTGDLATQANAGLARSYRWLGDGVQAQAAASAALAADAAFAFLREYDSANLSNTPHAFLVTRALQEMQPLPRLDFLDPKFLTREAGIAFAKAEEMHLIMAEAEFAANNYAAGRGHLANAIIAAGARGTTSYTDNDQRLNADLSIRPRSASITVRADASSPSRGGLVLDRPDVSILVPEISATSLDSDSIAAIPDTDTQALWHALHLARQEIMILEGRRMADLGIKLPIMQREIDQNPNINTGDLGTVSIVPSYIPVGEEMDFFTPASPYDAGGALVVTEITINVDMNMVLTTNGVTPFN
jgi:hypothetical protein